MKAKILSLAVLVLFGAMTVLAGSKTEKIKVYGNCGMCETRIEKAVKAVDGVTAADWNKETKMLDVTFDDAKVKIDDIHKAVAKVGHDTDKVKADDKVYQALPACCHYRR